MAIRPYSDFTVKHKWRALDAIGADRYRDDVAGADLILASGDLVTAGNDAYSRSFDAVSSAAETIDAGGLFQLGTTDFILFGVAEFDHSAAALGLGDTTAATEIIQCGTLASTKIVSGGTTVTASPGNSSVTGEAMLNAISVNWTTAMARGYHYSTSNGWVAGSEVAMGAIVTAPSYVEQVNLFMGISGTPAFWGGALITFPDGLDTIDNIQTHLTQCWINFTTTLTKDIPAPWV